MRYRDFIRIFCFTLLLAIYGGCILPGRSYQVTEYQPFATYMGHDLTIKRTTFLLKEPFYPAIEMWETNSSLFSDHSFQSDMQKGRIKKIAALSPGAVVRLIKIWRTWDGESGASHIHARGETILPESGRTVTFEYEWDDIGYTIERAPWDDESIPLKRFVGKDGKSFKSQ